MSNYKSSGETVMRHIVARGKNRLEKCPTLTESQLSLAIPLDKAIEIVNTLNKRRDEAKQSLAIVATLMQELEHTPTNIRRGKMKMSLNYLKNNLSCMIEWVALRSIWE